MAVPRRKTTPSRRGKRRSGHRLSFGSWTEDKDSGELHRPHHMIEATGMWRGRLIKPPKPPKEKTTESDDNA